MVCNYVLAYKTSAILHTETRCCSKKHVIWFAVRILHRNDTEKKTQKNNHPKTNQNKNSNAGKKQKIWVTLDFSVNFSVIKSKFHHGFHLESFSVWLQWSFKVVELNSSGSNQGTLLWKFILGPNSQVNIVLTLIIIIGPLCFRFQ